MYGLSHLRSAVNNPNLALREINRIYHTRFFTTRGNPNGDHFMQEDWDNLVILDACRYDLFEEVCDFDGRLEKRTSKGSGTVEFLESQFNDKSYKDTVYITGNPQLARFREQINVSFYDEIHVWSEEGWNEKYGTVLPETMAEYAIQASEKYPNKRLLIHFVQPHYPFLREDTEFDKNQFDDPDAPPTFWYRIMQGDLEISREEVWELYRENLQVALPSVRQLITELPGKTVITADHGNMIGERASPIPVEEWGHPLGLYTPELVEVPWFVCESENRKEILTGEMNDEPKDEINDEVVSQRLEDLGYI
ncbi:hypothetical protein [Haloferax denitrificans]|uniref:hypothetical protein n=1 Tax=Haloferax denitrificans TaxID=35745 RepID=UPI003C702218